MRYVAHDVMQTVYPNVVQCLQNVKHHVVQAIVDNVTLNLARSVIQCRTNYIVMHKCCAIVYNSLQPRVHKVAQNVSKIHNALRCTQRYTNCFKKCAVFCKVLHLQNIVDNIALNVHTMLKNRKRVLNNVGNCVRQTAVHSVLQNRCTTLSRVPQLPVPKYST